MYHYEKAFEEELIQQAREGDEKAFATLYGVIYKDMYRFALYTVRHPQDAEDAVSDTVISAYENISSLRNESSFRSWMFTILGNKCRKILKKRKNTIADTENRVEDRSEGCYEEKGIEYYHVREAFANLEEDDRMIVAYSVFGGYPSDEIAGMMAMNAATVRSRKSRALEKLRKDLREER